MGFKGLPNRTGLFYPLFNLTYIHNVLGEYQEAKEWYEKALAVNPDNKDAQAEYQDLFKKMKTKK